MENLNPPCSSEKLLPRHQVGYVQCPIEDLHLGPPPCQSGALSAELIELAPGREGSNPVAAAEEYATEDPNLAPPPCEGGALP